MMLTNCTISRYVMSLAAVRKCGKLEMDLIFERSKRNVDGLCHLRILEFPPILRTIEQSHLIGG
jgi:hypothetical protein